MRIQGDSSSTPINISGGEESTNVVQDNTQTSGFDDTSTISQSLLSQALGYDNTAGDPSLPLPISNDIIPPGTTPSTTNESAVNTPNLNFQSSVNSELQKLLQQNNVSISDTLIAQLELAYYNNIPLTNFQGLPSNIPSDLFQQLDQKVNADQQAQFSSDALKNWNINQAKQQASDFNSAYNQAFENLIAQKYPGDNAHQAQLRAAFYLQTDPNNPELKDIQKEVLESLQQQYANPSEWTPVPDKSKYLGTIINQYDNAFDQQLSQTLSKMSPNDQKTLKTMFYYQEDFLDAWAQQKGVSPEQVLSDPQMSQDFWNYLETQIPGSLALKDQFTNLITNLQAKLTSELSLPAGFDFQAGLGSLEAEANGAWRSMFDKILNANYSQSQIDAVNAGIANSSTQTDDVKALIAEISQKAADAIKQTYPLPETWEPTLTLAPLGLGIQMALNGFNSMEDMYNSMINQLNQIPDGPSKAILLNILKVINDAISDLEQLIYKMQGLDSQKAKELGQAQKDATLDKIAEQMSKLKDIWRQQDEAAAKQRKAAKWGLLAKIFTPLLIIAAVTLTILSGGTFGPVAITVMAMVTTALVADSIYTAVTGKDFIQDFFKVITDLAKKAGLGAAISAFIFEYALIIAVGVLSANPMLGAMLFAQSGVCKNTFIACGMNEKDAGYAAMAIEITVMIVCMVGARSMVKAATKASDGVGVGAEQAAKSGSKFVAKYLWKPVSDAARETRIMNFLKEDFVPWAVKLLATGTNAAKAASFMYQYQGLINRARAAQTQGELDEFLAEMEALIKLLKNSEQKIMQSMSGYGDWAAQTQLQMSSMYDQLRAASTKVSNSLQG